MDGTDDPEALLRLGTVEGVDRMRERFTAAEAGADDRGGYLTPSSRRSLIPQRGATAAGEPPSRSSRWGGSGTHVVVQLSWRPARCLCALMASRGTERATDNHTGRTGHREAADSTADGAAGRCECRPAPPQELV